MICLDTNYLILGLVSNSPENEQIRRWIADGTGLVVPAVVWFEFLCGPVDDRHVETMRAVVVDIIVFDDVHARVAADLLNVGGRRRSSRVDAMIAATAIVANVPLATNNSADFALFQDAGLRLA